MIKQKTETNEINRYISVLCPIITLMMIYIHIKANIIKLYKYTVFEMND